MANYPLEKSPEFKPVPLVNSVVDRTQYFNMRKINKDTLFTIINKLEERRPALIETWTTDPFIELLQKNFNAELLLPKRKKHMIVIYGNIDNDNKKLAEQLKEYFEAKVLIPNWNGVDRVEDKVTTMLLTKVGPPYLQPYNALSLDSALRIMAAT